MEIDAGEAEERQVEEALEAAADERDAEAEAVEEHERYGDAHDGLREVGPASVLDWCAVDCVHEAPPQAQM